jgi:anti-sigma-K factor RskA
MTTEPHTLSGAFVLDALSPEEAAQFRRHLDSCAVCREEVRELREAAARMGAVETVAPPPELKTRVLAAADRTPQKPPRLGSSGTTPAPRRWAPRVLAAAAAAVVLAGGAIGLNAVLSDDEGGQSGLQAAVVEVFQAPDAHVAEVETSHGPLRVATSPGEDEMAVDTSDLVALDQEHVYQLWAIQDGSPVSVGVLDDPRSGAAMELPETGTTVAITVEPAGGSEQPTTDPIAQVDPAAV